MDHARHKRDDIPNASTIARCRELLGDDADGLSDQEIDQIRRHADAVAHVTAKTADRTELQNLLKYCRTNKGKVHFVVVYNLTRIPIGHPW